MSSSANDITRRSPYLVTVAALHGQGSPSGSLQKSLVNCEGKSKETAEVHHKKVTSKAMMANPPCLMSILGLLLHAPKSATRMT